MNFPQVFDTWDSGSHGWVASLSRSLVLGSSSPRIGLLVAFWATFQARGAATKLGPGLLRRGAVLRQNPRASRSGLRARSVSIASFIWFISSVVFECAHQFSGVWALRPGGAVGVAAEGEIARCERAVFV